MEYAHARVCQGMNQVQAAHKEIGNSQEQKIVVVKILPGVPGNHTQGPGDNNAEDFCQAVEKQIGVKA